VREGRPVAFLGAPFSDLIQGGAEFPAVRRKQIENLAELFSNEGFIVRSAHIAENFGKMPTPDDIAERDHGWVDECDIYVALLTSDGSGRIPRSEGTFAELGAAIHLLRPVVLVMDAVNQSDISWYLRSLITSGRAAVASIADLMERRVTLASLLGDSAEGGVEALIGKMRGQTDRRIQWDGGYLNVPSSVISPIDSRSGILLAQKWNLRPGDRVVDVGCGTGILSIAAMKQGASSVLALDINPDALQATLENAKAYGFGKEITVRHSDGLSAVEGRYDLIASNPPYWDRPATDMIERNFYDEGHAFLRGLLAGARDHLDDGGRLSIITSDQGSPSLVCSELATHRWGVDDLVVIRPRWPSRHVRLVWNAKRRADADD
jgi:tRNA1(Val) A37 N6-methylase TrmN6/nucleoside 2-deoxyribosyltransferase